MTEVKHGHWQAESGGKEKNTKASHFCYPTGEKTICRRGWIKHRVISWLAWLACVWPMEIFLLLILKHFKLMAAGILKGDVNKQTWCLSCREHKPSPFLHLFFLLLLFFPPCLCAEWVTPRRFHCRVNWAETPIHQTGMCVLSLLTGEMRRKKKKRGQWVILAVFGLPSKPSYHPWAVLSPTQGPGAARARQNPRRINTKSSNGARGGETLHTGNKI